MEDTERLIEPDTEDDNAFALEGGGTPDPAAGTPDPNAAATPAAEGEAPPADDEAAVIEKILTSEAGQQTLNKLIDSMLSETEAEIEVVAQRAEIEERQQAVAQTLAAAYQEAQETGDWGKYGEIRARLDARNAALQRVAAAVRPAVRREVEEEVVRTVDDAVEAAFGDQLNALTQEELQTLRRSNFKSDTDFYAATLKAVRGKIEAGIRGELEPEVGAARQAMAAVSTAGKARGDGLGVLPGAMGSENKLGASSIGDLVRQGLRGDIDQDFDSD